MMSQRPFIPSVATKINNITEPSHDNDAFLCQITFQVHHFNKALKAILSIGITSAAGELLWIILDGKLDYNNSWRPPIPSQSEE
jgi:hypothetical protein